MDIKEIKKLFIGKTITDVDIQSDHEEDGYHEYTIEKITFDDGTFLELFGHSDHARFTESDLEFLTKNKD